MTAILLGDYDDWGRPVAVRDLLQDSIRLQLVKLGAHCISNGVGDRPGLEELRRSIRLHQECDSLGGDSAWFVTEGGMTPETGPRSRSELLANPAVCGGANSIPGDLVRFLQPR